MLKDFLAHNIDYYQAEIKQYIINHRSKEIIGTIFYTYKEYENYLQIYRTNKSQYNNRLEAFISLWMGTLIDEEEWHDHFEPKIEFADSIYDNWLKKEVNEYTFHYRATESLKEYVILKADRMKELIKEYRSNNPILQGGITYPSSIPGIYINRDIQNEQEYTFNLSNDVIVAEELKYCANWAGYKEIFIEPDKNIYISGNSELNR
ncbi:hypothetical protein AB9M62_34115 [Bacillales bacterium AN1005]